MGLVAILPMVGQLLVQGVELFAGDSDKLEKIAKIGAGALKRVPSAVEAVKGLFDGLGDRKLTVEDFDGLIARIEANDARINELNEEAKQREAD